jgi:hypothetical protein
VAARSLLVVVEDRVGRRAGALLARADEVIE